MFTEHARQNKLNNINLFKNKIRKKSEKKTFYKFYIFIPLMVSSYIDDDGNYRTLKQQKLITLYIVYTVGALFYSCVSTVCTVQCTVSYGNLTNIKHFNVLLNTIFQVIFICSDLSICFSDNSSSKYTAWSFIFPKYIIFIDTLYYMHLCTLQSLSSILIQ